MIRTVRNLRRLWQIARTLARHDALSWIDELSPPPLVSVALRRLQPRDAMPGRPGEKLAAALTALGPGFIKLGQALSTRADLVGEAVAADLSGLQDKLEPFPAAAARATIEGELGQPISELFAAFDDTPVAAASIAQVHFAETKEGRRVAVKVLRPGVERAFAEDIALFEWLARLAERVVPRSRRLKPIEVVKTLAASVAREMDLRLEAAAASETAGNFRDDPEFRVPAIEWGLTGRRVLTTERIEGIPIDERERLIAAGFDTDAIVAAAARVFFKMVFRDGFFHADMHPGNVFVAPDGALVAVDFGITGRIDAPTRAFLADMLLGFLTGDYRTVAEVHFRAGYVPADQDIGAFMQAARAIAEPIFGKKLADISLARLLAQLFEVTEEFRMETQPQLLLLQKSMLVCEGVGRTLNPEVNMWALARPLIEDWMRDNRGPAARAMEFARGALGRLDTLPTLITNLERASGVIASGGVKLDRETLNALTRRGGFGWGALVAMAALGAVVAKVMG
ncbi:MAG: 2-polyprenylphenol 6-hydroxylase [Alphaproteobacteria bacterium]|nr:2-polyprenylphenol 6-hydroxylase [Alphaproteobacteria bacterium]